MAQARGLHWRRGEMGPFFGPQWRRGEVGSLRGREMGSLRESEKCTRDEGRRPKEGKGFFISHPYAILFLVLRTQRRIGM